MPRVVIENGEIRAIYSDGLLPYIEAIQAEFGLSPADTEIKRATHIEPDPLRRAGGNWFVDLTPMGGPLCFADENEQAFVLRQSAIDFELRWLDINWLMKEPQDVGTVTEEE